MKLFSILDNSQRLDGGAMCGKAPAALWSRWLAPDEQSRIPRACRFLLLTDMDGRNVLFKPTLRVRQGVVSTAAHGAS